MPDTENAISIFFTPKPNENPRNVVIVHDNIITKSSLPAKFTLMPFRRPPRGELHYF